MSQVTELTEAPVPASVLTLAIHRDHLVPVRAPLCQSRGLPEA